MVVETKIVDRSSLGFNENIQYLRAAAAFSVMLYHAAHYVHTKYGSGLYDIFHHFLGLYGVAVFFALSGYLMSELSQRQKAQRFLSSRIFRIYPPLFIATFFAVLINPTRIINNFDWASLTLIPAGFIYYPLNVEWSLVNEMFFYIVIFSIILVKMEKHLSAMGLLWIIFIYYNASGTMPRIGRADISNITFMQANAGFAAGLAIPLFSRIKILNPIACALIFILSIPISYYVPSSYARISAGIGSAFLVAASVQIYQPILKGRTARITKNFGDWSYAMYLIHVPIILGILRCTPASWNGNTVYILSVTLAIMATVVLGKIDIKIHGKSRTALRGITDKSLLWWTLGFVGLYLILSIWFLWRGSTMA